MSPKVTRIILVTKSLVFMRFSSVSINLLEFFRIMSFVFDLKYLSQNSINFNMLGVFWNPQDEQFPKLSLDLHFEQHLKEILRVLDRCRSCWPPLYEAQPHLGRCWIIVFSLKILLFLKKESHKVYTFCLKSN